jgi:D-3-phosphoglycerate dehydrogenase
MNAAELAGAHLAIATPGAAAITAASVPADGPLTAILRTGVGYNDVDADALTARDIALVIPPEAVRRSTAVATVTLILAVTTHLIMRHRHSVTGPEGWIKAGQTSGMSLTGKTVGIVGLGNVGSEVARLLVPFDCRLIGCDPYIDPAHAAGLGITLMPLDDLMRNADVVSLNLILNAETRHIIDARRLGLMKPTAFLVNAARGPVVDQKALTDVLAARRIAGAGLDVLDLEPPRGDDPILKLDNVTISAHALNWNDEYRETLQRNIADTLRALMAGKVPYKVANAAVLERPGFKRKLAALAQS